MYSIFRAFPGAAALIIFLGYSLNGDEVVLSGNNFQKDESPVVLKDWRAYPYGRISFKDSKAPDKGIVLYTENPGDKWVGILDWNAAKIKVAPGLHYKLDFKIRTDADFRIVILEYKDNLYTKTISKKEHLFTGNSSWKDYSIDYSPSSDEVSFIRPSIEMSGWLKRLEMSSYKFTESKSKEIISVTADKYLLKAGEKVAFTIKDPSADLKMLVYGPDGTSTGDWEKGGSSAWIYHFVSSNSIKGGKTPALTYQYQVPPNATNGSYKVNFVDLEKAAVSEIGFTVLAPEYVDTINSCVQKINIPADSNIIFIGDSLTDGFRGRNYVSIIERSMKLKYPNASIINAGVGGDTITRIYARLKRDVIDKKPSIVFIFEGANDMKRYYSPEDKKIRGWAVDPVEYEKTYNDLLGELKKSGNTRIIMVSCIASDLNIRKVFHDNAVLFDDGINFYGLPEEVEKLAELQKKIASANNIEFADLNKSILEYQKNNKNKKENLYVDDGVHLCEYGHREVALALLKYLAVANAK